VKRLLIYVGVACLLPAAISAQGLFGVQRYDYEPGDVLPDADTFVRQEAHWEGYGPGENGDRTLLGFVLLSDDLVDVPVMSRAGLAVAVADADPRVREVAHWCTHAPGGRGAVREVCELILHAQGRLEPALAPWLG